MKYFLINYLIIIQSISAFGFRNNKNSEYFDIIAISANLKVSGFKPNTVSPGSSQIITISGSNFGGSKGSGGVYLKSSIDGGKNHYLIEDIQNYVKWTDNEIQIRVPLNLNSNSSSRPVTGAVMIKNNKGTQGISSGNLIISSTVINPNTPHIASFSPSVVTAGTGQVVKITGLGFGPEKGTGGVVIKNANDGGFTDFILQDASDYKSWSDKEIEIIVPSFSLSQQDKVGGSGIVKIRTAAGKEITSTTQLIVKYALNNQPYISDTQQKNYLHITTEDLGGNKIFYLSNEIAENQLALAAIKKAMEEWRCKTGYNIILAVDASGKPIIAQNSVSSFDHQCVIGFSSQLENGVLARTTHYREECNGSQAASKVLVSRETDIILNKNISWDYSLSGNLIQGKQDFYACLLHEIGHSLGLEHVNNKSDLMYYQIPTTSRKGLETGAVHQKTSVQEAVSEAINRSRSLNLSNCNYVKVISKNTDCFNEHSFSQSELIVYPNPGSGANLTISFPIEYNSFVKLLITDAKGKDVYNTNELQSNTKIFSKEIECSEWSAGIYFIRAESEKTVQVKQWMKYK